METNLPTPMTARVYVNLLEGICFTEMAIFTKKSRVIGRSDRKVMGKRVSEVTPLGKKMTGGLEHGFYDFPFSWEFHHPN